jgi:2-oxoglutarate dehydrogenase E2 component (dihydrolipoamide succinyltransferase)
VGRISPVVGRIAEEHDVDLTAVDGTGLNGRITKRDILAYVESRGTEGVPAQAEVQAVPAEKAPEVEPARQAAPPRKPASAPGEVVPLSRMRQAIAEHMVRSKQTSPHVTSVWEVDFSAVAAHRAANKEDFARDGINLTYTPYLVAAIARALQQHPMANSSWREDGILLHREINVGVATAIEDGLIVPVVKGADELSLRGLARRVNDLTERARINQLKPDEVKGGTFSLTNHGVLGSLFATPIINQPQCGILGVGKIEKRVKVINDAIAIRPLAYVSFTFDHRILDGKTADDFVSSIKQVIESWK